MKNERSFTLSAPIYIDGKAVNAVRISWPGNDKIFAQLAVRGDVAQVMGALKLLTGLPTDAVMQIVPEDWLEIFDTAKAMA